MQLPAAAAAPIKQQKTKPPKYESATSQSSAADISLPGMKPGSMPAGCYLRATIDGKKWEATEMTPDRSHPSLIPVNGQNGDSSITFVIGGMRDNIGKPRTSAKCTQSPTLAAKDSSSAPNQAKCTVTKMDDQFIEGTFNFTAEKDGKKVTCTDGEFRVPAPTPSSSN